MKREIEKQEETRNQERSHQFSSFYQKYCFLESSLKYIIISCSQEHNKSTSLTTTKNAYGMVISFS